MSLLHILLAIRIVSSIAYAVLVFRLVRSGRFLSLRLFTAYCAVMCVDIAWSPVKIAAAVWIDPIALCLRAGSVIEAVCLASAGMMKSRQKDMLMSMVCLGIAGSVIVWGYFDLSDRRGAYYALMQHTNVCLGVLCVAVNVHQVYNTHDYRHRQNSDWDRIWLPHLRLISAYVIVLAVASFLHAPGDGSAHHHLIRIAKLSYVSAWSAVWLWYDRRELRATRFKRIDPGF